MNTGRIVVTGALIALSCLLTAPAPSRGDVEDYTTPEYTDNNGYVRDMWVEAQALHPTDGEQFWATPGVADTCYDVEVSGNWSYGAYCSAGSPDDYSCSAEADVYQNNGSLWNEEASDSRTIFMPIGPTFEYQTAYYDTYDSFLGAYQGSGGLFYWLDAFTSEFDETYYPGFSASVVAVNRFNCACNCP